MNVKLVLLLLLFPFAFQAQVKKVPANIVNPGSLYSTYDFEVDAGMLKPAIKLQGGSNILPNVVKYGNQSTWPTGMQTLDSRLENKATIMNYKAYKIAATADYCVLVLPASENKHMESSFRPAQDIYFVMELEGANYAGNPQVTKIEEAEVDDDYFFEDSEEDESAGDEGLRAKIVNPGDLYPKFNLKENASIRELLIDSGILSEEEFDAIVSRANESGWPSGISTIDSRLKLRETMKNYVAYYLIDFGTESEYTLIWIPKDENMHMPVNMRPQDDDGIFFVLKSEGVEY